MRSKCLFSLNTLQVSLGACVVVRDGGKENVDPAVNPLLSRRSLQKKAAAKDDQVAHCTQTPITRSKTSLKRARNQEQGKKCTEAGEPAPLTPRISRSMNVASAWNPVDMGLQTPMPESDAGSGYGPPPPNTTPTPLREYTSGDAPLHSPYCEVVAAWIV